MKRIIAAIAMKLRLIFFAYWLFAGISGYAKSYGTIFPTTENPLSESGRWLDGLTTGLDWTNINVNATGAHGTQSGTNSPPTNDSVAVLNGISFGANQECSITVRVTGAPGVDFEEFECFLRATGAAHSWTGYEINWSTSHNYAQVVRWNGALNNFTLLNSGAVTNPVTGGVLRATISGTSPATITVYLNGVMQFTATDSSPYTTGSPGIGSYFQFSGGAGSVAEFSITSFFATDNGAAACNGTHPSWDASTWADAQNCLTLGTFANGDTITLTYPMTASSTMTSTFALILKGAGACTLNGSGRPTSCPIVVTDNTSAATALVNITLPANNTQTRITNLEFTGGAGPSSSELLITGQTGVTGPQDSRRYRVDHVRFDPGATFAHIHDAAAWGVLDHNYFNIGSAGVFGLYTFENADYPYADARWAETTEWGSTNFLLVENNAFVRNTTPYAATDSYGGARIVYRFNDVTMAQFEAHGTESAGRARGTRAVESYKNNFDMGGANWPYLNNLRSGPILPWGNTVTNDATTARAAHLNNERSLTSTDSWGTEDGTNFSDVNDAGNPQATYTAAGTPTHTGFGTYTIQVQGSPSWMTNQFSYQTGTNYHLHKVGCKEDLATKVLCGALIIANTSNVLTFAVNDDNFSVNLNNNDVITLNLVTHALDGPCRSGGSLLSLRNMSSITSSGTAATATLSTNGFATNDVIVVSQSSPGTYRGIYQLTGAATNTFNYTLPTATTSPAADPEGVTKLPWGTGGNDQVEDSCYQWLNTQGATNLAFDSVFYPHEIVQNIDYYDYDTTATTSGTNQTVGVRSGTLANRPGSCTVGVAYWATDKGNWNQSGSGGQGTLYRCIIANNWYPYYTPNIYPAPLSSGSSDVAVPVPGSSGTITTASVTSTTLTLNWTKATDAVSAQSALQYEVCQSSSAITTVIGCESALINSFLPDIATANVVNLTGGTTYHFNVVVEDEAGNKTLYTDKSQATTGDGTAPTSGASGAITFSSVTPTTLAVNWTKATDVDDTQSTLLYEVCRSTSSNVTTTANCEANGTIIKSFTADIATANDSALSAHTTYYYNVVVEDPAGNKTAYSSNSQLTTDTTFPTAGNSGTITTSGVTANQVTLNWTKATDTDDVQANLQYEVCLSLSNNISSVANCEAATIIRAFTADIATFDAGGLNAGSTYYFNAVVKDPAGNKTAYNTVSQLTSGGNAHAGRARVTRR